MLNKKNWAVIIILVGLIVLNGCSPKEPISEKTKPAENKVKNYQIGVLLSKSNSYNENDKIINGINRAIKLNSDIKVKVIKPSDFVDAEEGLRYLAENSYDLVIAVGDEEAKVANQLAREYQDVPFAIINVPSYSPNLASLQFKDEEGIFLAGSLSALLTKSDKVAFVGGLEKMPEKIYQKAFTQGVEYINQQKDTNVEVFNQYTGNSWDASKVNDSVKTLSDKGVDIFFNGFGREQEEVLLAAAANKKHAIGIGENQRVIAPGAVYTSVVDNFDNLIYNFILNTKKYGFKGGTQYFGLSSDCVTLLNFNNLTDNEKKLLSKMGKSNYQNLKAITDNKDNFTPEIINELNTIKTNIKSGKIKVNF